MNTDRPFDSLGEKVGSNITIKLKDESIFTGDLVSFDIHLNIVLNNVVENDTKLNGKVLIRGDSIAIIKNI